jgi:hypothetical protein
MSKKIGAREKHLMKLLDKSKEETEKFREKMNEAKKDAFKYHEELLIIKKKIADGRTKDVDVSEFTGDASTKDTGKLSTNPEDNNKKPPYNSSFSGYMDSILGMNLVDILDNIKNDVKTKESNHE